MKPSTAYSTKQNLSVLLVGEQKAGKTNIMFAFPDPYILDCDRNLARAVRVSGGKKFWFDDPYVDDKGQPLAEKDLWNNAVKCLKEAAKSPEVRTICIDGLAALADMLIAHILAEALRNEGKKLDRMRIQDYQPLKTLMTSLVLGLRSTGKYLVVTSHQKTDKDELTGRIRYTLNMPGSLSENFGGFFTDVWAAVSRPGPSGTLYELHTRPTGYHVNLGTTLQLDGKPLDVSNKNPEQVWATLAPHIT